MSAVDGIRGVARRPRGAQLAARSYYRTSLYGIQPTSASSPGPQLFQGGAPETSLFGLPATACADDTVRDGNSRYVPPMMRATPVDCVECAMGPPSPRRGIRRFLTKAKNKKGAVPKSTAKKVKSPTDKAGSTADKIREIIALRTFEGFWEWTAELLRLLELNRVEVEKKLKEQFNAAASKHGIKNEKVDNPFRKDDLAAVIATMLVITFLDKKASDYRETWELVGEKAQDWVKLRLREMGDEAERFENLRGVIDGLF